MQMSAVKRPLMGTNSDDDEDVEGLYRAQDDMGSQDKLFERKTNTRCFVIVAVFAVILSFVAGILIGTFAIKRDKDEQKEGVFIPGVSQYLVKDGDPAMSKMLMDEVSAENIRANLRMLTQEQHLAGTDKDLYIATKVKEHFEKAGLDHVTLTPYEVMLSYPNSSDPSYVELLNASNATQYKSDLSEKVLTPEENKTNVVPPFNAYSAPGDLYGTLVYVNYGRMEDYLYLINNKSINITGKIVFVRYGEIYRGDKVKFAERFKAKAVVLFSDPAVVTNGDFNQVYPKDWYLPPTGLQRGTLFIGEGDPLTPDYPAIETAYRENAPDFYIPKIPCHPISYGTAVHLMENMGGEAVPKDWQGGMNVTYRFGDSFKIHGWKAHIKVSTRNQNATTYNVIGVIRGSIEPDRYVLVGNHLDAWVFGAIDPSSGTAVMMEIARVMGEMVKSGKWRPRRSIVFCGWGSEEYGLIGSTEWIEEYTKSLGSRGVAYLNVDYAFDGNFSFNADGTPLIYHSLIEATKKVANPNQTEVAAGRTTVYDTWWKVFPDPKFGRPEIKIPGSGSDYATFRDKLGLPFLDMWYTYDPHMHVISYPMYHSVYDTFLLVDQIQDRGFHYHRAIGQIWVEMTRDIAETLILPFNISDYAAVLHDMGDTFIKRFGDQLKTKGLSTDLLRSAINNFTEEVHNFENRIKTVNKEDPFVVRSINDQLMQLDRAFLDPAGLPGRRLKRHVLFADSTIDNYSGASFPGLSDALVEISLGEDVDKQWEIVKKHYSVILFMIEGAAGTLREASNFVYKKL